MSTSVRPPFKKLPADPDLRHLRNQAKQLLQACRRDDLVARQRISSVLGEDAHTSAVTLQQVQSVVAQEYGFRNWQSLRMSIQDGANTYDDFAEKWSRMQKDQRMGDDLPLSVLLDLVGDPTGLNTLDAGCGSGYVSRILADRGARVTGIDVSRRMIELAKAESDDPIDYRVSGLSKPLPEFSAAFDLVVGHFVINDIPDHVGFARTVGNLTKQGGRLVLMGNNPYSAVPREKAKDYFDSGTSVVYHGIAQATGIQVFYYQRTLEEYSSVFRDAGFLLRTLSDVRPTDEMLRRDDDRAQSWNHFPVFSGWEFVKM